MSSGGAGEVKAGRPPAQVFGRIGDWRWAMPDFGANVVCTGEGQETAPAPAARIGPPGLGALGQAQASRREREVLALLTEGLTNRQIADALIHQ